MAWCLVKHRDNFTFTLPMDTMTDVWSMDPELDLYLGLSGSYPDCVTGSHD